MKRQILTLLVSLIAMTSYAQNKVTIFAAANVRDAMEEMRGIYLAQNPDAKVNINFGASGMLTQQIINGAECDIFFSADETYAKKLHEMGLTTGDATPYAGGMLLLYSRSIDITQCGMEILTSDKVKKIAVANPSAAPYGERAVEAIKNYGVYDKISKKIVFGENISSTAGYTFSGNTEVGFIALSQSKSPNAQVDGYSFLVPTELYSPIIQSCVKIKQRHENDETDKFLKFVLGEECKEIWIKYGYNTKF